MDGSCLEEEHLLTWVPEASAENLGWVGGKVHDHRAIEEDEMEEEEEPNTSAA